MCESSGQEELGGGFGWCRIDSPFPEALLLWLGRDGAGVISALCGGLATFLYPEGGVYALVAFPAFAGLLFTPYYLLLFLGAFTAGVANRSSRWRASGSWGLFVAGMLFTLWQAYGNPNFEAGVRSSLAIEAGDWQEAAKEAGRVRAGATRDVVINGRMANSYLGRPFSRDPEPMIPATYKDSRQGLLTFMQLCGLNMNYYGGQTNICYRWAVELSVEYQTLFHKDWAERYGRMIDQPELISQDPEFARIPKDPLPNRFVE